MDPNQESQEQNFSAEPVTKKIEINSEDGTITEKPSETQSFVAAQGPFEETPSTGMLEVSEQPSSEVSEDKEGDDELSATNQNEPVEVSVVEGSSADSDSTVTENKDQSKDNKVNPMAIPPKASKNAGLPKAAIVVAVGIAITLIIVTVLAFTKSQNSEDSSQNTSVSTTSSEQNKPTPATTEDVDQTSAQIDQEVNKTANDDDIPSSDSVSDESLNL